jgi:hypothetical protein
MKAPSEGLFLWHYFLAFESEAGDEFFFSKHCSFHPRIQPEAWHQNSVSDLLNLNPILMRKNLPEKDHAKKRTGLKMIAATVLAVLGLGAQAATVPDCSNYGDGDATNITYMINGVPASSMGSVQSGDHVQVCFNLEAGDDPTLFTLVSYSAPAATFNASEAHLQTIFDVHTAVASGSGMVCLEVDVPSCYFQVDFVRGCAIMQLGVQGFYSGQGRLIAGKNGGSGSCNCVASADAGVTATLDCSGVALELEGSTYVHNPMISWTAMAGGSISAGGSTLTPSVNASGMYVLTVTDTLGCSASDTVAVTGSTLEIDLGGDITICVGGSATLDAGVSGMTYNWSTGATTQMITVSAAGTYSVTVTDGTCTDTDEINVSTVTTLDVDLGADIVTGICTGSVTLDAGLTGSAYLWSTGETTQMINVMASGTYYVTVTGSGGCMDSDTINVTINPATVNVDLGADLMLCAGETVMLDAGNAGMNFNWSTGATTQMISVSTSGMIMVTVSDNGGCMDSDTINVTVMETVDVNLGPDINTALCTGSITLDAGVSGMTYLWSTGETSQAIMVSASGTYYVTVTNMAGCEYSDTIQVTINPASLTINLGNDTTFMTCTHETITLDAGVAGGVYLWNTSEVTQTITVSTSGTYAVSVTDGLGCSATDTINITIIDNTVDVDLGSDTVLCGGCIELSAGNPGASYTWCSGENYAILNVCTTGQYCVTVSNGLCIGTDTINVTINAAPMIDLGNDTIVAAGAFNLDAGISGATYLWSTGETTQMISVTASGTYYVTVTDMFGCSATDSIEVNLIIGVEENMNNNFNVNIYPNPSLDKNIFVSFETTEKADVSVRIVNIIGNQVYAERVNGFKGTYNKKLALEDLASGVYFAEITKGSERIVKKITLK